MRLAEAAKRFQCGFDIEQMTDHIEQQNDVEGFAAIQFIHINGSKFDVWMARHRLLDHCGAEINPQAALWLQPGELVPQSAAHL